MKPMTIIFLCAIGLTGCVIFLSAIWKILRCHGDSSSVNSVYDRLTNLLLGISVLAGAVVLMTVDSAARKGKGFPDAREYLKNYIDVDQTSRIAVSIGLSSLCLIALVRTIQKRRSEKHTP